MEEKYDLSAVGEGFGEEGEESEGAEEEEDTTAEEDDTAF